MIPSWTNKYIGLPYESRGTDGSYDCWTLFQYIYKQEKNIILHPGYYNDANNIEEAENNFNDLIVDWIPLEKPEQDCLIMMNIAGHPVHVGMCLDDNEMIHTIKSHASALEKFTSRKWRNRIEGFYRCPSM